MPRWIPLSIVSAALVAAPGLHAQDVEQLGRVYGTRPPQAYFELQARQGGAFRFERGWSRRLTGPGGDPPPALLRAPGAGAPAGDLAAAALGRREAGVRGTFRFPLVLGLFSNSPEPAFTRAEIQREFFDGPNSRFGTIPELYHELSGGRVTLVGETFPWVRTTLTQSQVAGGVSGLSGSARVGEYILQILADHPDMDWGRYDNDGPDGVPNSGDDDGFVDVLAVLHPTPGAECGGEQRLDRVWSHRWSLMSIVGQHFVTTTTTPSGGRIRVDDYTIQPVYSCADGAVERRIINEIGVFAHELGHGFGLPDLYDTDGGDHAGTGRWDLMGSGAWGCGVFQPEKPCHMSAWSKAALGWVEVEELPRDRDLGTLRLGPVETEGRVYRIDAGDGSGEYFLLENRQRVGFDEGLREPGLLVWHIDPEWIESRWRWNSVNASSRRMGVWLRQADGLDQLALASGGNTGDTGDPFPGSTGNPEFHAGRTPRSVTHGGDAAGVTLLDIALDGSDVTLRAVTRYQSLRVRVAHAPGSEEPLLTVDGAPVAGNDQVIASAPFEVRELEAAGGEILADGIRRGFVGWADDPEAPRRRRWVTGLADAELVAEYGPRQVRFRLGRLGDTLGITSGSVTTNPSSEDLWFEEGTDVVFLAEPARGFAFQEWQGALAGRTNPAVHRLDVPAEATAVFRTDFRTGAEVRHQTPAATETELILEATNGNPPLTWFLDEGRLPEGLRLIPTGIIDGAALESGTFELGLRVRDAYGLTAGGRLVLEVRPPELGTDALVAPFFPGSVPLTLTDLQRAYLDRAGNGNGSYDLGDFRAWVLAHPDGPATTPARAVAGPQRIRVVDLPPGDGP